MGGSQTRPRGREVEIGVVVRDASSAIPYPADTVILRFAPAEGLRSAELRRGARIVGTLSGPALISMQAVGGRMAVYVDGPRGCQGPYQVDWVKMDYPPGSRAAIGWRLPGGEQCAYIVDVSNDDVRVLPEGTTPP